MHHHHQQHVFGSTRRTSPRRYYSGTQTITSQQYREWQVTLERRETGTTLRRIQFSARLQDASGMRCELLSGFFSTSQALAAAHRRIDFIIDIELPRRPRRRRRPVHLKY